MTILVVDDNKKSRDILRRKLRQLAYIDIMEASNADEAKKIISERSLEAIIVKYDLPEVNGIEFSKQIRQKGYNHPILLKVSSSTGMEVYDKNLKEPRIDHVLAGSFSLSELRGALYKTGVFKK